jgi:DNA-directed RNA polymerase subunit H (RpoH/RPB5)
MKIQIFALSKPSKKITGEHIDVVESDTTPLDIMRQIADKYPELNIDEKYNLIVDKTASIPRIAVNDPVNEYYNGHVGDMYRIVDDSSTRFRLVAGTLAKNKTKTSPFHDVTADMYYSAYNTVLDMLKDRSTDSTGSTEDDVASDVDHLRITPTTMKEIFKEEQFDELDIKGIRNRRGQYMYVYFLQKDDSTPVSSSKRASGGAKVPFKKLVKDLQSKTVEHFNENFPSPLAKVPENDEEEQEFIENFEIIVVYNNQHNESPMKHDVPAQFFSVQQLVFNVTKHMDQPSFYLLDPVADRAEILDVLSLNGLVLDKAKPLRDFNIKEGTKLILL